VNGVNVGGQRAVETLERNFDRAKIYDNEKTGLLKGLARVSEMSENLLRREAGSGGRGVKGELDVATSGRKLKALRRVM
jgi:hypothetical protein